MTHYVNPSPLARVLSCLRVCGSVALQFRFFILSKTLRLSKGACRRVEGP